jgi:hypothetical protein
MRIKISNGSDEKDKDAQYQQGKRIERKHDQNHKWRR